METSISFLLIKVLFDGVDEDGDWFWPVLLWDGWGVQDSPAVFVELRAYLAL